MISARTLRLLPAVVLSWLAAWWLVPRSPRAALAASAIAIVLLAAISRCRGRWVLPAAAALGAVCAVGASAGVQIAALERDPWPIWTHDRAAVEVRLRIDAHARLARSPDTWQRAADSQRTTATVMAVRGNDALMGPTGGQVVVQAEVPDNGRVWVTGDEVTMRARASPGDRRRRQVAELSALDVMRVEPAASPDARIRATLASALPPDASGALVLGMALGDDSGLPDQQRRDMLDAGLSHLTAVSGANIAIVVGLATWSARLVGLPRRWAVVPGVIALLGYVSLTGPEPSVLRAAVMALLAMAAIVWGGGSGLAALQSAALLLLVLDPWLAYSRGFALSCAATAGLLVAAGPAREIVAGAARMASAWRVVAVPIIGAAVVACAAAIATAPLLAAYGQGVSWISVVANTIVAPVVALITVVGLVMGLLGLVSVPAASAIAPAATYPASGVLSVAARAAGFQGGRLPWPGGLTGAALLIAVLVLLLLLVRRHRRAAPIGAGIVVVAALVSARAPAALADALPSDWALVFCDVGQGDSVLLRSGPSSAIVVDTGPDPASATSCAQRSGISTVDALVLTHFHRDHVGGTEEVLRRYHPSVVLVSPLKEPAETYQATTGTLQRAGVTPRTPQVGETLRAGWVSWQVIAPSAIVRAGSSPNNTSVSMIAAVDGPAGSVRSFLGGDLESEGQARIIAGSAEPHVDVAKVPHHGSARQDPQLPRWTGAQVAVVSCGRGNDYGHPAAATVGAWEGAGAIVTRTDVVGDVVVRPRPGGGAVVSGRAVPRAWEPEGRGARR